MHSPILPAVGGRRTGGEKRRIANALPKVFSLMNAASALIIGAIRLVAAYEIGQSSSISFHSSKFIGLAVPHRTGQTDFSHRSLASRLTPTTEQQLRTSASTAGSTLNAHLLEDARFVWRVLKFSPETCGTIVNHSYMYPCAFEVDRRLPAAIGIVPTVVSEAIDPRLEWEAALGNVGLGHEDSVVDLPPVSTDTLVSSSAG